MGLLDDIAAEQAVNKAKCLLRAKPDGLSPPEWKELQDALDRIDVQASAIERVLARRGVKIGAMAIRRHRKRDCSCDPR